MSLSAVQEAVNPSHYQIIFAEAHVTDCALVTLIDVLNNNMFIISNVYLCLPETEIKTTTLRCLYDCANANHILNNAT